MIDQPAPIESEDGKNVEAELQEKAAVKEWLGKIEASRKHDSDERKRWKKWRSFMGGTPEGEDGEVREFLVDAPLLQSVIETALSNTYASEPDVSVVPADSVDERQFELTRAFCKTLEIVLSRQFADGDLKATLKREALSAMTNCIGWIKPMVQQDKKKDPIILNRISDVQDNLARVDRLIEQIGDPSQCGDLDARKAELNNQLRSLQEQVEVRVARGTVFDFIRPDDIQVSMDCPELADYLMSPWIAQRTFMSMDKLIEFSGLPKDKLRGATMYAKRSDEGGSKSGEEKAEIAVWEIWDRESSTVHTVAEGVNCYVRQPYGPSPVSRRFYPFFALSFHWVDDRRWPRGDVDLGHKLQEEASRSLSQFAVHRRRVRPKIVFDRGQLTPEDVRKLEDSEAIEFVGLDPLDKSIPLQNSMFVPNYPPVDPGLYDITPYRQALEELFGLSETRRGGVIKTKTLGEAEMVEQGSETRMDWRRDAVETQLQEIARYLAELLMQAMPLEEVQKLAGPGAMWPQLSKDEIYTMAVISIRAGSSGKPNTRADREAWGTLMPIIDKSVTEIAGLMSNPMTKPLADVKIELLKETVRRLDDRIDVTRFIPKVQPMAVAPVIPGDPPLPPDPNLSAVA